MAAVLDPDIRSNLDFEALKRLRQSWSPSVSKGLIIYTDDRVDRMYNKTATDCYSLGKGGPRRGRQIFED